MTLVTLVFLSPFIMKKAFCLPLVLFLSIVTHAQTLREFSTHVETLFQEGNKCYITTGNKSQLQRIIDSLQATINLGFDGKMLDQKTEDSLLLGVKMNKLKGDYHYLNSDLNRESYAKAEVFFRRALDFTERAINAQSQEVYYYQFVLHEELGQLYYKQGRYQEAYNEMQAAYKRANYMKDEDEALDFVSQQAMCEARIGLFDEARENIHFVIENYQGKNTESYGEALRKKAKILMLQSESGDKGTANPRKEALKCYKEYFSIKKADALQHLGSMNAEDREHYWMRIRPFVVDCYRIEDADPAFLYDVTLFSKSLLLEYAQSGNPVFYTWKQVQEKLKKDDCAIEFIQYEKAGAKKMGALVLKKKGKPTFVEIADIGLLEKTRLRNGTTVIEAIRSGSHNLKDILYTDQNIFSIVWPEQLLKAIGKDTKRLYFAADGIFHQLAVEYMLPDAQQYTDLKATALYRLSSTRQLMTQTTIKPGSKVLVCGGIDFDMDSQPEIDDDGIGIPNDDQAFVFMQSLKRDFSVRFDTLAGTRREMISIENAFGSNYTTLMSGNEVTETNFIRMAPQYPIVHIGTHGYFGGISPKGNDLVPPGYDECLSQSILALSGINYNLANNSFDASQHDGILSAREIAQMDLSNTDLIVLSACQTGQGYMTDDGIYGIQRGLKNAGVKGMIVSLWSVSDKATAALMQSFYNHLKTNDAHTAFMLAREDLINSYRQPVDQFDPVLLVSEPTEPNYNLPEYYDAFILIDVK